MLLQHVPIHAVGIPWKQWIEQQRERIFAEARAERLAASGPSTLAQSLMFRERSFRLYRRFRRRCRSMMSWALKRKTNDMRLQAEPNTSTQRESSGVACPCWQTGRYHWNNRCPSHLVKNLLHFSLEELHRLMDLVKNAQSLDEVWPILDRLLAARD
jgi:hypothetical protein